MQLNGQTEVVTRRDSGDRPIWSTCDTVRASTVRGRSRDPVLRKPSFQALEELDCDDERGAWPAPIICLVLFSAVLMLGMLLASWLAKLLAVGYAGLLVEFAASSGWTLRKDGGARGERIDPVLGGDRRA